MRAPRIDLFEWLLKNASKATYNLAFSNIYGLTMEDYQKYSGFTLPKNFDLGSNTQFGAIELKKTLSSIYDCEPDNIVATMGASEANFLVFSSLLTPGDEFIVEQPGYQPMWLTPEMLGARRIPWPRKFQDKFRVDAKSLQNRITKKTKLIVLTNLHNPSGILTDKNTIKAIARIAQEYGAYVLVDEIFLDGSFVSQPSSFGIPNVIATSSTTKIYGLGGLHTGWVIAPKKIIMQCQKLKTHSTGASSKTSEIMTAYILQNARANLIKRFQKRSKANLEYLRKWMDHHKEWFEWVRPDGGIICFPKYSMDISSIELCKYLLTKQKILVNPGAYFNQDGFIRLSYGCDLSLLQSALDALETGLRNLCSTL
jgi:aspartate/methionine/tyrosine aminotransferase